MERQSAKEKLALLERELNGERIERPKLPPVQHRPIEVIEQELREAHEARRRTRHRGAASIRIRGLEVELAEARRAGGVE